MNRTRKSVPVSRILVADDDLVTLKTLEVGLTNSGFNVSTTTRLEETVRVATSTEFDIILLDVIFPDGESIQALPQILAADHTIQVIMLTGSHSVQKAVDAMKNGAFDYLQKPVTLETLLTSISHALHLVRANREIARLKADLQHRHRFSNIIGESRSMQMLFDSMGHLLDNNATVLLQADSGTGKELVARAIHFNGKRSRGPFVAINCVAIPEALLESELFGHEKGAFTGAINRRVGRFEQANHGTVFLDEVGEMSLDAQARLLRVLQERSLVRIGGNEEIPINVRIIAATNQNLREAVEARRFREDLYYRLSVFPLEIPPLRERKDDIPLLTAYYINYYRKELEISREIGITAVAMECMVRYLWPGNVRELENVIQRALIVCDSNQIEARHLTLEVRENENLIRLGESDQKGLSYSQNDRLRSFDDIERDLIIAALEFTGGNISAASEQLQLGRATLYRKIKKYDLDN